MSGICAAISPDAELLVRKMCDRLHHRGPDDEGFYVNGNLALGHRALAVTDAPVVHQPLANEDKKMWITFDGEIYNKLKLIEELKKNHTLNTDSSAEVMVHTYEEEGANCLNRFNGMFAFSIWDCAKQRLFCARDRIGIKPFYYCNDAPVFLAASEVKAVLSATSALKRPNEHIIYEYLTTGHHYHAEETFFLGIKSLLPAHYMIIDRNGTKIRRYWTPIEPSETHRSTRETRSYASEFREMLGHSIKVRLPPQDLPVGTLLSGGLDSTSIACLLDEILKSGSSASATKRQRQELFSAIYREDVTQGDERPYIEEAARAMKTRPEYVFPSVAGRWNDLKQFVYYIEEPISVFNYYVFWCLSREARDKVKVVFYGITGGLLAADTVAHYRRYLRELWRRKKIARLLIELVGAVPRFRLSSLTKILDRKSESEIRRFLAPQFADRFSNRAEGREPSVNDEYRRFRDGLLDHLRICDRVSSAFSIEPRYPFLDHRIVEFTFSLPADQKIKNGWTKYVLRNAMKDVIPEAIRRSRRKFGTPIPLESWMRELSENIRGILQSDSFRERGYLNQSVILDLYDRFYEGKMSQIQSASFAEVLWRILNLELWLETYFD